MSILLAILLFFVVVLIIIFSMLKGIASLVFGGLFGKKYSSNGQSRQGGFHDQSTRSNANANFGNKEEKVFAPDEGEYVKFEEVE